MDSLRGKQLLSAGWMLAGTGLSRGAVVIANIFVARTVPQSDFGALGIVQNTVTMLGVLGGFGLGMAATKYVAERRTDAPARVGAALGVCHAAALALGMILAIMLFAGASWIAGRIFGDVRIAPLLRVSVLLVALSAVNSVQVSAIIGFESFRALAKLGVLAGVATVPIVIAATSRWGVIGAVVGLTIAQTIAVLAAHVTLRVLNGRGGGSKSWRFSRDDLPVLHAFGLPALLGSLAFALADWAGPALVVRHPNGLAQIGLFSAANQWLGLLVFLPIVIGRTWMPAMCSSLARGDIRGTRTLLTRAVVITLIATAPLFVGLAWHASRVMSLYGAAYGGGGTLLVLVLVTGAIMALIKPADYLVHSAGAVWQNLVAVCAYAAIYVGGTYVFIQYGVQALVVSRLCGVAVYAIILLGLARLVIGVRGDGGFAASVQTT